jgi:glycosyltransferase involved in cell wall biosynthesis
MTGITHISSVHSRYDIRIFLKECRSLSKAGYTVNLVVADGKGDEERDSVHILDAGGKKRNRFWRMTETLFRVYKKAVSTNAAVYHLHDPELLLLVPRLLKHGNVIYDTHEDLPRQILSKHWIPRYLRSAVSFISEKVENHYSRKVTGIVAATAFIGDRFKKINNNVVNINNYPLLEEFADIERRPSNERLTCYIGGISIERGILEMVKAMEFVNGKLILAGNFSNPEEREKAKKLSGWKKVIELGFCDREKVREILSSAKVGLLLFHPSPNHTDAQPNKLFEYMAAGLPIIASDFPLWRDIIDTSGCGIYVNPLNPNEIATSLNFLFSDPEMAEHKGESGKVAVVKKYNWEYEKNKLLHFYHFNNKTGV